MDNIKQIIVSGCSFTENRNSWAYVLSKRLKIPLKNLAVPGAGNRHIARSVILYLEQNKVDSASTLIIVMWTNPLRTDWLVGERYPEHHLYSYGNQSHLAIPGSILQSCKTKNNIQEGFPELLEIAYRPGKIAITTASWESMNHLNVFLKNQTYNFVQTAYFDPAEPIPNNFRSEWGAYGELYNQANLTMPTENWLSIAKNEHLGNFVCDNKLLHTDNIHPSSQGYQEWVDNILIKKLVP